MGTEGPQRWLHRLRVTQQVALPPWLPGFPAQAFPTADSALRSPQASPRSQQLTSPWGHSRISVLQLPALCLPGDMRPCIPLWGMNGFRKVCLRDSHSIQTLTDQLLHSQPRVLLLCPLNSFLSLQGRPRWDRAPASVPHPPRAGPGPLTLFCPTSSTLPSSVWFYIVFSGGQVLLPALFCRSARSPVSEGVFLRYLWRQRNSTPTCSSAVSFPLI